MRFIYFLMDQVFCYQGHAQPLFANKTPKLIFYLLIAATIIQFIYGSRNSVLQIRYS